MLLNTNVIGVLHLPWNGRYVARANSYSYFFLGGGGGGEGLHLTSSFSENQN